MDEVDTVDSPATGLTGLNNLCSRAYGPRNFMKVTEGARIRTLLFCNKSYAENKALKYDFQLGAKGRQHCGFREAAWKIIGIPRYASG